MRLDYQKDVALNGNFQAGASARYPFGDVITLSGGAITPPTIGVFTTSDETCGSRVTVRAQVVDTFYVKDMFGLKYHSEAKQRTLETKLRKAITEGAERAAAS